MPSPKRRRPKALNRDDTLPKGDYEFLGQKLRGLQDYTGRVLFRLHPEMTVGELRRMDATISGLYGAAAAVRARFENLTLQAGEGLPPTMGLEERFALALDVAGVDPYELEPLADEAEREAARRAFDRQKRRD